jgi:hypothetical protein
MRTNDHDTTEALHYTTANRNAWNAHVGALVLPERLMREAMTSDLSEDAKLRQRLRGKRVALPFDNLPVWHAGPFATARRLRCRRLAALSYPPHCC